MAIVEMKHVDMLALEKDKQPLLRAIQKLGCFQLVQADSEDVNFSRAPAVATLPSLEETITRLGWAIGKLHRYDTTKKPLMADKPTIDEEQAQNVHARQKELMATVDQLEALERRAGDLRGQIARVEAAREQLLPWRTFALPLDEIQSTRNTVAMLGSLQKTVLDEWIAQDKLGELCYVEPVSAQRDQVYAYLLLHRTHRDEVMALLKEANFVAITLPASPLTAEQRLTELDAEQAEIEARQKETTAGMAAMAGEIGALMQLFDVLSSQRVRLAASRQFSVSERTFFLQGWVPAPMTERIEQRLKKVSPTVALEFTDPAEGEEPPVLLHNAKPFAPFESVVSGFSLPSPGSIDPTAIMTPFYINFMGMMISDAGYGLLMAIVMPLLIWLLKPAPGTRRMLWILTAGGVATVVWGALYNTWFGFGPFPSVFDPVNNALPVMGVCIALGAVHLFTGLGMAAYLNIRRGKPLAAVADQLSWFLLVVGLGLMIVLPSVGQWVALTGAGIVLVTAGRDKSRNPFKRLISGLGALYGATSWISDLLSYMRLFGMGLATGVIGMVINILVGMVFQSGIVGIVIGSVLFVGGHMFNLAINTLGAYVHSCRLQYIEFFGKFYEDGGKPFAPLTETTRYVYIREAGQPT
ncbi:MAG: V-type ATP synthase subunit I [Clostridiales bacterium]|nr:V-type ATP synthase subunit I [Clostridiales bacterium]